MSAEPLRQKAMRAGLHLTLRRVAGLVLGFIGLLYLTRLVGPGAYGAYAAAMGMLAYFATVGNSGGRVFLIRQPEEAPLTLFHLVHTCLLVGSLVAGGGLMAAGMALSLVGTGYPQFATVLAATALSLPLQLLRGVPMALMERRLDYGRLAVVEVGGQVLFYGIGIPIAWQGGGLWSLVAAHWGSELFQGVIMYRAACYRPRWFWHAEQAREVIIESLKMSAGAWVYELRRLGLSLVLLPLAGERMVGYYAVAERLINSFTVVSSAIAQLSLPLYSRLQHSARQLLNAIYLSAQAQLLSFGIVTLIAVLAGRVLLPSLLGAKWDTLLVLMTTAALGVHTTLFIIFGAQAQAMYIIRKTGFMFWLNVLFIAGLFPLIGLFTWLTPAPYKPVGYVLGYLLAHQLVHLLLHVAVGRWIGKPIYGMNLVWAAGLSAAMFAPFAGYWSLLGLLVFLHPASLRAAREIMGLFKEARGAKSEASQG